MITPFKDKTPRLGKGVFVAPDASIIGNVTLGDYSSVWFKAVLRGDVNFIQVGDYTNIQDACLLHVTSETFPLYVGNSVTVGHGSILHGCRIGNRCLIGMGAVILDGAEIGEGCLVASGSVVLEGASIPPRTLVAGIPAVKKKNVDTATLRTIAQSALEYAGLAKDYLEGLEADSK